ncbi:MAG: hypothetical protein NVV59_10595 [Chitinophagaceae bacterium]|nr:hypothetical protein [Chitinophagaceae bacterium]
MVPDSVRFSFIAGGVVFIAAVAYTVFTTREYSPEQMKTFGEIREQDVRHIKTPAAAFYKKGLLWTIIGLSLTLLLFWYNSTSVDVLKKNCMCLRWG